MRAAKRRGREPRRRQAAADDEASRQRAARGSARARAADGRHRRDGLPDRQDPRRLADPVARPVGALLPVPGRARGAPRGVAQRHRRRATSASPASTWRSSPISPRSSTRCRKARARCSTTAACCTCRTCSRARSTTTRRCRSSPPAGSAARSQTGRTLDYRDAGDDNRKLCSLYLGTHGPHGRGAGPQFGDADTRLALF